MATRTEVLPKFICDWRYRRSGWKWPRLYAPVALTATLAGLPLLAQQDDGPPNEKGRVAMVASDVKGYVTAPLHARRQQWVRFGAALGAIAFAHQYDDDVRDHFETVTVAPGTEPDTEDGRDAAPAVLALGGTWLAAANELDRCLIRRGLCRSRTPLPCASTGMSRRLRPMRRHRPSHRDVRAPRSLSARS